MRGAWALGLLLGGVVAIAVCFLIVFHGSFLRWDVVAVGNSAWNEGTRYPVWSTMTRWGARREARRRESGPEGTGMEHYVVERRAA